MRKSFFWKVALVLFVTAVSTMAVSAIPNLPVAPYEGACGYHPYVSAPPYYWVGPAVSYSQCRYVELPAMIANAQSQGHIIVEAYCKPAKYCAQ
ncbi:MAG TPA: hypothetical protein VL025_02785 [Thermoanaerobaculia bacterium]|nr:hypothetical protein [Thermoanaerobaculia bacterium]